jgi:hypothetical protein
LHRSCGAGITSSAKHPGECLEGASALDCDILDQVSPYRAGISPQAAILASYSVPKGDANMADLAKNFRSAYFGK